MRKFLQRVRKTPEGKYINIDTGATLPKSLIERYAEQLGVEIEMMKETEAEIL